MNNSRNYLLVTACKNEGENLPDLIESVVVQTIQPILWVIVDDGSTDDTPKITMDAAEKNNWIHVLRMKEGKRDLGLHYANVIKTGFDYAISYCKGSGLEYRYLGNLDGDLLLEHTFYENLMQEFDNNHILGIASGGTDHLIDGEKVRHSLSENEPSGGHMLIRSTCFEECGGIPLSFSIDSFLKAKARLRGWKTRRFEDNVATEIRDVSAAEGYWKGFVHIGESAFYFNLNPLHLAIKIIKHSFRKPYYGGIAISVGYFGSIINRKKQTEDVEVKNYFWNKWKGYL